MVRAHVEEPVLELLEQGLQVLHALVGLLLEHFEALAHGLDLDEGDMPATMSEHSVEVLLCGVRQDFFQLLKVPALLGCLLLFAFNTELL